MTATIQSCPICGKEGISADSPRCPQCDAELACFQVLESFPIEGALRGVSKKLVIPAASIVFGLVVGMGVVAFENYRLGNVMRETSDRLEKYRHEVETMARSLASKTAIKEVPAPLAGIMMNKQGGDQIEEFGGETIDRRLNHDVGTSAAPTRKSVEADYFLYETSDTDTLWDISERWYTQGRYFPVLIAMNPEGGVFDIKAGRRLKILKEIAKAHDILRRVVTWEGGKPYLEYEVRIGDTDESLSKKFYKYDDWYPLIREANPDIAISPGLKIKVPLAPLYWTSPARHG